MVNIVFDAIDGFVPCLVAKTNGMRLLISFQAHRGPWADIFSVEPSINRICTALLAFVPPVNNPVSERIADFRLWAFLIRFCTPAWTTNPREALLSSSSFSTAYFIRIGAS